jgi:integrase
MVEAEGKAGLLGGNTRRSGYKNGKLGSGQGIQPHWSPRQTQLNCPQCGNTKLFRDGKRKLSNGVKIQRWLCVGKSGCGLRFSETSLNRDLNLGFREKPLQKTSNGSLNMSSNILVTCRGSDEPKRQAHVTQAKGTSTLAEVETRKENAQREGTAQTAEAKGKILEFAWHLKKNGYSPSTITVYGIWLRTLLKRGADLLDGESVKETIAQQQGWTCTSKANVTAAYRTFADYLGINWKPPKYTPERKYPFIPLESELDALIAASGKKTAAVLQLLKETGMRIGEARRLCWTDVDLERLIVTVNSPEKKSNPRVLKISSKLAGMLNALPRKNPRVFSNYNETTWRRNFLQTRKRNAVKLQNPRLEQITFHTFRHWKGTMEYHRTKDPWHVKTLLGHKSIRNTELYINIEQAIFQAETDEFTVKVAEKPEEIKALLEVGFEYVCEKDGLMFFRKRK